MSNPMSMIMMDPPQHTRYRRLVSRSFSPRDIDRREPLVRRKMATYLEPLMDREVFDLVEDYCGPFPAEVICSILGIPEADHQMIRHLTDESLRREEGEAVGGKRQMEAAITSFTYYAQFVADKRGHPGDDMCTDLLEAQFEADDGTVHTLSDFEVAGFISLLAAAGSETVTKAVGNAAVLFHRNPDQWAKVVGDAAAIPGAVEETLRYWAPSQYQGRFSLADSSWHGVTIPAGKPVFLLTGAANHDPRGTRTRTCSTSIAQRRCRSPSDTASTAASARPWPDWRSASPSTSYGPVGLASVSTRPVSSESRCRTWRGTPRSRSRSVDRAWAPRRRPCVRPARRPPTDTGSVRATAVRARECAPCGPARSARSRCRGARARPAR